LPDASRFVLLSNFASDAVLDRNTGLVWQRSATTTSSLDDAISTCRESRVGLHYGWRMPSLTELQTLFDNGAGASTAPQPPFSTVSFRYYATSTLVSTNSSHYWLVWANETGSQMTYEADRAVTYGLGFRMVVLCVRGPGGNG